MRRPTSGFRPAVGLVAGSMLWFATYEAAAQDARVGTEVVVDPSPTAQDEPAVAATSQGYQVFWSESGIIESRRFSEGGSPLGGAFQVSDGSNGQKPSASPGVYDDVLVVWDDVSPPQGNEDVWARRYTSSGQDLGPPWRVNATVSGQQTAPAVGRGPQGFVVAWEDSALDGDGKGIAFQRLSLDGTALGTEVLANAFTSGHQKSPAVAVRHDGQFLVTWQSEDLDDSSDAIVARLFDAAGLPLTSDLVVNEQTQGSQRSPAVTALASGGYVVAWSDQEISGRTIKARRISPEGLFVTPEIVVDSAPPGTTNNSPQALASVDDTVVLVWRGKPPGDLGDVYVRRFDSQLVAYAPERIANSSTNGHRLTPKVAGHSDGDFLVVWQQADPPLEVEIRAQAFATSAVGDRVWHDGNENGLQDAGEPGVAGVVVHLDRQLVGVVDSTTTDDDGRYRFSPVPEDDYSLLFEAPEGWRFTMQDAGIGPLDNSDSDVDEFGRTQEFSVAAGVKTLRWDAGLVALPSFADGFESGDTSAWSSATP